MILFLYLLLVSPPASAEDGFGLEVASFFAYVTVAMAVGIWIGKRTFAPVAAWLDEDRAPTQDDLQATLAQPLHHARWVFVGWAGGALLFAVLHMTPSNPIHYAPDYGVFIGSVSALGGLAAAMLSYLLIEHRLRPIFAMALEETAPLRPRMLGVRQRFLIAWALGSGVVFIAIVLTPFAVVDVEAIWMLAVIGLVTGGVIIGFAAGAVARPIAALRNALALVERGDFDARVDVDDGSEVGVLQAGFNQMATGLKERERLRSIFGTYVDQDIAEHILRSGTSLEGEEVEVTVMFLDVRDFTGFAERAPAREVVATINRLFERIVPVIREHGGHVDKFVGDGVLAVFGAPRRQPDHADRAVRAAVDIVQATEEEFGEELRIGVGVNTGTVVAGNIGGGGRLEFSVIGDPVNVAQRVEAATRATGDTILISQETKDRLQETGFSFVERRDIELKGKSGRVCLFAVQ